MKNHAAESGNAQAMKDTVASNIIKRITPCELFASASRLPASAPTRYPARFAAPRKAATGASNHPASIITGSNGV
ncbi:hypothetical protein SAMN05444747_11858 [Variovorax sp. OV329]|nr:hypothetical protein SAMN05444747_11858 [Variovorax sp. OV329]